MCWRRCTNTALRIDTSTDIDVEDGAKNDREVYYKGNDRHTDRMSRVSCLPILSCNAQLRLTRSDTMLISSDNLIHPSLSRQTNGPNKLTESHQIIVSTYINQHRTTKRNETVCEDNRKKPGMNT
jgi:hypothetical protein